LTVPDDSACVMAPRSSSTGRGLVAHVLQDRVGELAEHGIEMPFVGQVEGEQEIVVGHDARFYSESRSNSTRAR
jgi:hypothetical protein